MSKILLLQSEDKSHLEILKDPSVKKTIITKLEWPDNLLLIFNDKLEGSTESYINIKYGDYIRDINHIIPDRSPKMWIDYIPKNYKKLPNDD